MRRWASSPVSTGCPRPRSWTAVQRRSATLIAGGEEMLTALRDARRRPADRGRRPISLADADLLAPVPRPGKIVAIGRNYRDHTTEEGVEPPPAPLIFAKWPSSVVGHGAEVCWDPEPDPTGRLRGRAGGRDRADRARRRRGRGPRPRPRLHLPERRLRTRPPVRRRPVGPRQVARHASARWARPS